MYVYIYIYMYICIYVYICIILYKYEWGVGNNICPALEVKCNACIMTHCMASLER